MLVVNASNIIKDFNWIAQQHRRCWRRGRRQHQLALRADRAAGAGRARRAADADRRRLADIKYYWFTTGEVAGVRATISRTGYTGEDGFEVFVPPATAERVWDAILQRGTAAGVVPGRARRARHAAARGGDAAVRQRHGRDDDRARGGSRLDRRLEEGSNSSAPRCCGGRRQKASARKLVGFEVLDRAHRASRLRRRTSAARRPASSPAARRRRS